MSKAPDKRRVRESIARARTISAEAKIRLAEEDVAESARLVGELRDQVARIREQVDDLARDKRRRDAVNRARWLAFYIGWAAFSAWCWSRGIELMGWWAPWFGALLGLGIVELIRRNTDAI
jgi:hypothetical protein